jgi:hypothetical protein
MATLSEKPDPKAIEGAARGLWAAQHLPPAHGPVGPAEGPVVHQFEGAFAPQEDGMLVVQRAVAADVDARAMILVGRRAQGILRKEEGGPPTVTPRLEPLLTALGVWVGGTDGRNWDSVPRRAEVQALVGRLAHMGAVAVRDVSLRICPACALARSPERIVYQEEDGETLLVRFPFPYGDRSVSALVWTDAPWRLLGTSALMVHPDQPYVIARYRRRGAEELVFTSKASLDRLRTWLPGAELEVLEEFPGRHWEGQVYVHPLRHEFPMGGSMEPPAGTIVPVADVSNSGTGVVPLVPGHGGTDTQIADRLNVPGWPLITPKGRFDILLVHKYAGLELESGSEFVERDLAEDDAIFARLRVRRGVPHCSRCGTPLIWAPGRAWCLEPSRLPEEKVAVYRSLLPHDRPIEKLEAVPWPVSEPQRSDDPAAITLLECSQCDLLEATGKEAERCSCGGRRRAVRRRLLQAFDAAASAWAAVDPIPAADIVRLYVSDRRRAPAVVHHIAAMSGVGGSAGEVRLTVLPTVPEANFTELIAAHGADAVRAALVRAQSSGGATATFSERCVQESRRLAAFWRFARDVFARVEGPSLSAYSQPIGGTMGDLEPEDRAFLARFERLRIQCLVDYDRSAPGVVHRRLFHFLENDAVVYREWVASRLVLEGNPPSKRAALHTLVHVLANTTSLLGPIAPHISEVVHRTLRRSRASLFEEAPVGVDRALLDEARVKTWDRWCSVVRALDQLRQKTGLHSSAVLPSVALIVDSDLVGSLLRADAPTIERLARVRKVDVGSPGSPWGGRRREVRPRESEIQRVYANRAAQIIHLLRRMPERKGSEAGAGQGFSMIVNGQPTQILPSMVDWVETLPAHVVPVGWGLGELYAELPADAARATPTPPPLSRDGLRLVSRVAHRLRESPPGPTRAVVVAAPPGLAEELAGVSEPVAKYLGVTEFRIVSSDRDLPVHQREFGRTRAGAAWSFHISGAPRPARAPKRPPSRTRGARVRPAFAPGELTPTVTDYSNAELIAREAGVRALGEELDEILGSPLLGPSKVGGAWDQGLRSVSAFRGASWDSLSALPGFGPTLATELVTKFGGEVPPRPARQPRPARDPENGGFEAPPATAPAIEPAPYLPPPPPVTTPPPSVRVAPPTPSHAVIAPPYPTPPEVPPSTTESSAPVPLEDQDGVSPRTIEELVLPADLPEGTPEPLSELNPPPPASMGDSAVPETAPATPDGSPLTAEAVVPRSVSPEEAEFPSSMDSTPAGPESEPIDAVDLTPAHDFDALASPESHAELPPGIVVELAPEQPTVVAPNASPPETELPVAAAPTEISPSGSVEGTPSDAEMGARELPQEAPAPDPREAVASEWPPPPEVDSERGSTPALDVETPSETPPPAPAESPADLEPESSLAIEPRTEPADPVDQEESARVPSPQPALEQGPGPSLSVAELPSLPPEPEVESPGLSAPVPVQNESSVPSAAAATSTPPPPASLDVAAESAPAPPLEREPLATLTAEVVDPMSAPVEQVPAEPAAAVSPAPVLEPEMIPVSDVPPAPPPPPPPTGGVDLVVGTSYFPSLERFLEATAAGHQGVCIVRDSPERVRAYVGSRPVEIRWLTNIGRGLTLKPSDLDGFSAFLSHAVTTGQVTAFFIEGTEYLVRLHGLDKVVERMLALHALAREHSARVWLPLNPKLLSQPELDRFVAAFGARAPAP